MTDKGFGRNALYSGVSWLVPAVVAVFAVPVTVRGLGASGYGIITLVGAFTGYLALLDLGLGRGVVRFLAMFVARRYGRTARECLALVMAWFAGVGVVGALTLWVIAPWLSGGLFKIPAGLESVATAAFRVGGLAFAIGMVASALGYVLEAFLRYDLVALLHGTFSSVSLAGPAVLVSLGYGILAVVWFSVALAVIAALAWGVLGLRELSTLPREGPPFKEYEREFIGFSVTVAANRVWTQIQLETSKVVVGVAGGVAQAGIFQVPNLITSRITGLLSSLSTVLLPTGSQLAAEGDHDQVTALYTRASRLFYILNASMTGAVVVFAAPLLTYWVGPAYGRLGGQAFALLVITAGLNATSMSASHLNMAMGRPKVNLAFSLTNSFINLGTVYFLTVRYGIAGTAASGLLAAAVVPFFLHYSHRRVLGVGTFDVFRACYLRTSLAVSAVALASWFVLRPLAHSLVSTLALAAVTGACSLLASAASGALTRAEWGYLRSLALRDARQSRSDSEADESGGNDAGEGGDG